MLTGDKNETAVKIALTCGFIDPGMRRYTVQGQYENLIESELKLVERGVQSQPGILKNS